jgi:hypothetical protein
VSLDLEIQLEEIIPKVFTDPGRFNDCFTPEASSKIQSPKIIMTSLKLIPLTFSFESIA